MLPHDDDHLLGILRRHPGVPDGLGIDDDAGPAGAPPEATAAVDADAPLESGRGFELRPGCTALAVSACFIFLF